MTAAIAAAPIRSALQTRRRPVEEPGRSMKTTPGEMSAPPRHPRRHFSTARAPAMTQIAIGTFRDARPGRARPIARCDAWTAAGKNAAKTLAFAP
jgi:hypothetical protein